MDEKLAVEVEAINDDGDIQFGYGYGYTNDEAVQEGLDEIIRLTGDDTYVMNEWRAA